MTRHQILTTIENEINRSTIDTCMRTPFIHFCHSLTDIGFLPEPEADGNGWQIMYMNECIGHINFNTSGVWIDHCDFKAGNKKDDFLIKEIHAHIRLCEHFHSNGKQCGCGRQPGYNHTIFSKPYHHVCFAQLEFLNPDTKTLKTIIKTMMLIKSNKDAERGLVDQP